MDVAPFSYNLQQSKSTSKSPFEFVMGRQPLTPSLAFTGYIGPNPSTWQEQMDEARVYLEKAAKRMKKWADKKRRARKFQEGSQVLVKLYMHQKTHGLHHGLMRRYEGPFSVIKRVGKVAYKLQLSSTIKVHPVFHISQLKPYSGDAEDPSCEETTRPTTNVREAHKMEAEAILSDRVVR